MADDKRKRGGSAPTVNLANPILPNRPVFSNCDH
jgi:hypothetical protein